MYQLARAALRAATVVKYERLSPRAQARAQVRRASCRAASSRRTLGRTSTSAPGRRSYLLLSAGCTTMS
jgi:hypothetical protein